MARRLFRSTQNKMIGGVCGGLAEYFDTDPSLIRIAAVALLFTFGAGLIAYIIGWIILPRATSMAQLAAGQPYVGNSPATPRADKSGERSRFWSTYFPGLLLVTIGGIFLLKEFFYWLDFHDIWPVILILAGVGIIVVGPWRNSQRDKNADPMNANTPVNSSLATNVEQSGELPK